MIPYCKPDMGQISWLFIFDQLTWFSAHWFDRDNSTEVVRCHSTICL